MIYNNVRVVKLKKIIQFGTPLLLVYQKQKCVSSYAYLYCYNVAPPILIFLRRVKPRSYK